VRREALSGCPPPAVRARPSACARGRGPSQVAGYAGSGRGGQRRPRRLGGERGSIAGQWGRGAAAAGFARYLACSSVSTSRSSRRVFRRRPLACIQRGTGVRQQISSVYAQEFAGPSALHTKSKVLPPQSSPPSAHAGTKPQAPPASAHADNVSPAERQSNVHCPSRQHGTDGQPDGGGGQLLSTLHEYAT
jgi:hypothetical protein